MRRLLPVFVALVAAAIAAPAAGAHEFAVASLQHGELRYSAAKGRDATLAVTSVAPPARITGPAALRDSLVCVSGARLHRCARIRRTAAGVSITVLRPVRMMLSARGAFSVAITGSPALREVFISGCGVVAVRGAGAYTADGHASTPLTPSLVSVQLRA